MPIRRGDGTPISPKGYQEVRKGDGTVLWSASESTAPDKNNLLAHWDFSKVSETDGAAYSTVRDLSGNENELIGAGATHAESGLNGLPSAHFDGVDDHLDGPGSNAVDISNPNVTVSVYFTWQALDASTVGYPLTQTWNGSRTTQGFGHLYYGTDGQIEFALGGDVTTNTSVMDTNPHVTAALIDRPAGEAVVSWDGTTETTTTGSADNAGDQPIRVGARGDPNTGENNFFNGHVGEILIYEGVHDIATHDAVLDHLSRWTEQN